MRCTSYCTASSYEIPKLFQFLAEKGPAQLFKNVIHFEMKHKNKPMGDIFFFSYGTLVCWGLTDVEEKICLSYAKKFGKEPNHRTEFDEFTYSYGSTINIVEDEIMLPNKSTLSKLAVSHGIAQSAKLAIFEELIQQTINLTQNLPRELARSGKIFLSRKQISKRMGELFIKRSFISLHSEILDVPEFFWYYPELEPLYRKAAHYLDVIKRIDALNKRLTVIHDLFEMLGDALNHQYSSRLEWIVIILIGIAVIVSILTNVFNVWGRH